MANYYQELIARISEHIQRQEYRQASDLIEEELKLPYVPSDTYDRLIEFRDEIRGFLIKEPSAAFMSEQQVEAFLAAGGEKAYQAVSFLKKANIREFLDVIQEYMLKDDADRMVVSILFDLCHRQGVNTELQYCDNGTWKKQRPAEAADVTDNELFRQTAALLASRFENSNPSFLELCRQVLVQHAYLKYPEKMENSAEILTDQIVRYVFEAIQDTESWKRYISEYGIDEKAIGQLSL
ncbi:MAG: hypothetical protein E7187_08285 [Erysipelotrichaceae bacterium]|nr:hypothetical protein [Erysipelotrichaceae bacterium]